MYEKEFSKLIAMARGAGSNSLQPIIDAIGEKKLLERGDCVPSCGAHAGHEDALNRLQRITTLLQSRGFPVEMHACSTPPVTGVFVDLVRPDALPPIVYGDYVPLFSFNLIEESAGIPIRDLHVRMHGAQHLLSQVFRSAAASQ